MRVKPIHIAFGVGLAIAAVPSLGSLRGLTSDLQVVRQEAKRIGAENTELQLSLQEAEQKAAVAESRYKSGCIPVVTEDQSQYVALQLNRPVLDVASKHPLPVGSVVCDAHGNTGVIVDDDQSHRTPGVTQRLAFTGNTDLVQERLDNYRGARYTLPQS